MHAIIVKLPDFAPDNQHIKVKSFVGTSWWRPVGYDLQQNVLDAVQDQLTHLLPGYFVVSSGELPDGSGYAFIIEARPEPVEPRALANNDGLGFPECRK